MSPQDPAQAAIILSHFETVARTYEKNNDGVTNLLGARMISLASSGPFPVPITPSSIIHDNASGPGIVTDEILRYFGQKDSPPKIHCTDFSPPMISMIEKKGLPATYGIEASVMDSGALSFPNGMFTHSFTSLGIFMIPDPTTGTQEIYRTLQPGGLAFVSTIKHPGWLPPFQRAQKRIRPADPEWGGMLAPEWSTSEHLKGLLEAGGFGRESIYTEAYAAPFRMAKFLEAQAGLASMATGMLTKPWEDGERAAFTAVLEEEVEEEAKRDPVAMQFWIAVARK